MIERTPQLEVATPNEKRFGIGEVITRTDSADIVKRQGGDAESWTFDGVGSDKGLDVAYLHSGEGEQRMTKEIPATELVNYSPAGEGLNADLEGDQSLAESEPQPATAESIAKAAVRFAELQQASARAGSVVEQTGPIEEDAHIYSPETMRAMKREQLSRNEPVGSPTEQQDRTPR